VKKPRGLIVPPGMKWCCGEDHGDDPLDHLLPLEDFALRASNKTDGRQGECRKTRKLRDKIYNKENSAKNVARNKRKRHERTEVSIDMKKDLKCDACGFGSPEHHMCLTFHHVDPSIKEFNIADAIRDMVAMDRIREEIEKSVVLCSNCHAIITYFYTQYYYKKITKEDVYNSLKIYNLERYLVI
jgi:hypothetical protein